MKTTFGRENNGLLGDGGFKMGKSDSRIPVPFGYDIFRRTGFGALYVTPEARQIIEDNYGDILEKTKAVSEVVIALRRDDALRVTINSKERAFYVESAAQPSFVFADPEVKERFEKDYGAVVDHTDITDYLPKLRRDEFFKVKKRNGQVKIDFSPAYIAREETKPVFNIMEGIASGTIDSIVEE